jgi:hypothetical protein
VRIRTGAGALAAEIISLVEATSLRAIPTDGMTRPGTLILTSGTGGSTPDRPGRGIRGGWRIISNGARYFPLCDNSVGRDREEERRIERR